jgi:hypothetical protein
MGRPHRRRSAVLKITHGSDDTAEFAAKTAGCVSFAVVTLPAGSAADLSAAAGTAEQIRDIGELPNDPASG